MAHIRQMLVKFIHLVAVSAVGAHWDPLVTQLEHLRGGVTPTHSALNFLEYLYPLVFIHSKCMKLE